MDVILEQELELEKEIQDTIMSKTMPEMNFWKKMTTKGKNKGEKLTTAKNVKKVIDKSIKEYLTKFNFNSISMLVLAKEILSKYEPSILHYNITLNKSGKTVKVTKPKKTKVTIPDLLTTKVGYLKDQTDQTISPVWQTKKAPNPFSKQTKTIIMEGKMKELVVFHVQRKHTLEWESCLACKAIRAFIQWEFHQPVANISKKENKILSGKAASLIDKAAHAKQIAIEVESFKASTKNAKQMALEVEIVKEATQSNIIKNITVKSLNEDDLLFKSESQDLDFVNDDPFTVEGGSHGSD